MKPYNLGERIKSVRKSRNMKQKELAKLIGSTGNNVASIEKGTSTPRLELFAEICKALDIPADYLLQDVDDQFIRYAIVDYYKQLDRDQAKETAKTMLDILG